MAFGVGPAITIMIGALLMFFYGLDEKQLKTTRLDPTLGQEATPTMPPVPAEIGAIPSSGLTSSGRPSSGLQT